MSTDPTDSAPRHPWEQQADEPQAAYEAFCCYRDRSHRPHGPYAQRRSQARTSEVHGINVTTISRYSAKYDWVARCEAYDRWIAEQTRQRIEEERLELALEVERGRLEIQRRRLRAVLGDPDAVDDPDANPRTRGLVENVLGIAADLSEKGTARVNAWRLLEDRSGLYDDDREGDQVDVAALLKAELSDLAGYLDREEARVLWLYLERALSRRAAASQPRDAGGGEAE